MIRACLAGNADWPLFGSLTIPHQALCHPSFVEVDSCGRESCLLSKGACGSIPIEKYQVQFKDEWHGAALVFITSLECLTVLIIQTSE